MLRNGELITSSGSLSHCLISYNPDSLLLFCQICPVIASFAPVAKWKPLVLHIHKHVSNLWTYYFSGFVSSGCLTQDFPSYQRPLSLCPPSHLCWLDLGLLSFLSVLVCLCEVKMMLWHQGSGAAKGNHLIVCVIRVFPRWAFGQWSPLLQVGRAAGAWRSGGILGLPAQHGVPEADAGKWTDLQTEQMAHPGPWCPILVMW